MRVFFFISFALFTHSLFAQLYSFQDSRRSYFVELLNDSARLEVFSTFGAHEIFNLKEADEILIYKANSKDTIFSGHQSHITKRKGFYYLLYKSSNLKKSIKIELEKCTIDKRDALRKQAYHYHINRKLFRAQDSLSGPTQHIKAHSHSAFPSVNSNTLLSFDEYKIAIDHISDSIQTLILFYKKPLVDHYYTKANSLKHLDSAEVFDLLSKANYSFSYGKYFLHQVALKQPEYLIRFIDHNPRNKDTVLRTIKWHKNYKEITHMVKEASPQTKGKEEIVKQSVKRRRQEFTGGALFVTAIFAEIGLIVMLVMLISK